MDTYEELCARIVHKIDTLELIELLEVSSEDLLARFEDRLELNRMDIEEYLDESVR